LPEQQNYNGLPAKQNYNGLPEQQNYNGLPEQQTTIQCSKTEKLPAIYLQM